MIHKNTLYIEVARILSEKKIFAASTIPLRLFNEFMDIFKFKLNAQLHSG